MRFHKFLFSWVCFLVSCSFVFGQSPNGKISGLVLDPTGGAISSADLLAVDDATGVKTSSTTNSEGIYVFPNLPPGPYRLQVSKPGFKTLIKPDIVLNIQDALSINFTLPVGAVSDSVTVQGGAAMVNTVDGSISTVVDQSYVANMPLNGRSFQDLILITPGTVTQSPQNNFNALGIGQTGEFSVNGQRQESNNYTVDGVSANLGAAAGSGMTSYAGASGSVAAATSVGTTQALVSVDDLQEFRVQSSTYSAEYGRYPGGQFAFETKSGTNNLHGTTYDYLRNGIFDAQDWFNDYFGTRTSALRQNDFGGTLGGRILIPHIYDGKNRTFFFFSYEGLRLTAPQAAVASFVPDLALRTQAPASLQPALNAFPLPSPTGVDDTVNGFGQYIGTWSNPSSIDSTSVRLDHDFSNKLRLFFRFSDTDSAATARRPTANVPPTSLMANGYSLRTYTMGATTLLTDHLSNEFRLNYSSNDVSSALSVSALGGSDRLDLIESLGLAAASRVDVFLAYKGYQLDLYQSIQSGAQRQWNFVDALTLAKGRHEFKLGIDQRRLTPFALRPNPSITYFYTSRNAVTSNTAFAFPSSSTGAYPLYLNFSAFVQDEWKISPRLSLSEGIRWEVNPAPGVTQGTKPYTVIGTAPTSWSLAPQGTPLWDTTWYNLAPRLGVAYLLRNDPAFETIIRGGTGVFFDTGQQAGASGFNGPGFVAPGSLQAIGFPTLPKIPLIVNPPQPPYATAYVFEPHLQLPYTLQWTATLEQALGKSQVLTVSYVGSRASRLLKETQISVPSNPNGHNFFLIKNGLDADYNSLQSNFRRRLSGGLTALASYTWSHCIDYGSQNYLFGYERGNCDFDVRHNFSLAFSYDLPKPDGRGIGRKIFDNWGIDDRFIARSAFPVTFNGNALVQPDGELFYAGLNMVPGEPIYLSGTNCAAVLQGLKNLAPGQQCPGNRAVNPSAFVLATTGHGNAPRNFVRGFGAWQMNLAVRREFPILDALKLQFRAEAFNVFNHPNFGAINSNFGQSSFGQTTATLSNSLGILSPLYQEGGPRSMQFAVKAVF